MHILSHAKKKKLFNLKDGNRDLQLWVAQRKLEAARSLNLSSNSPNLKFKNLYLFIYLNELDGYHKSVTVLYYLHA